MDNTAEMNLSAHKEMAPSGEFKFGSQVSRLFEEGLNSEDVYAYHGTSIEALTHLAKSGRLPSNGSYGTDLFIAPVIPGEDQLDHAKVYANWNGAKYYVLESLPFRPKNMERFMWLISDPDPEDPKLKEVFEEAAQHGIDEDKLKQLVKEGNASRKGVVLSLSRKLIEDFKEEPDPDAPSADDQKKITLKDGLPIDYITGIEPIGQYEWDELVKIQDASSGNQ